MDKTLWVDLKMSTVSGAVLVEHCVSREITRMIGKVRYNVISQTKYATQPTQILFFHRFMSLWSRLRCPNYGFLTMVVFRHHFS